MSLGSTEGRIADGSILNIFYKDELENGYIKDKQLTAKCTISVLEPDRDEMPELLTSPLNAFEDELNSDAIYFIRAKN